MSRMFDNLEGQIIIFKISYFIIEYLKPSRIRRKFQHNIPVRYIMAREIQPAADPKAPPIMPPATVARGPCLNLYNAPVRPPAAAYL